MLPHRQSLLDEVHQRLAGGERLAPVCRGDGGDKRGLTDRDRADAVRHREGDQVEPALDLLGHLREHGLRRGMPFIGERLDGSAMVVVADVPAE